MRHNISRLRHFYLLFVLVFSYVCAQAQELLHVRFAPEKDYGPFIYQDESGQIKGLSWDILQEIAPAARLQIETQAPASLAYILEQAKLGKVELISSLRPTPERALYLGFTQPYVAIPAVLIRRLDSPTATLQTLTGARVAVGKGYAVEHFVREKYPGINWVLVADDREALLLMAQNKVAAMVADIASTIFIARREQYQNWRVEQNIGFEYQLSFAYPKTQTELGRRLELALSRLPVQRREAILARWLDTKSIENAAPARTWLQWGALLALLIAALIGGWEWQRQRGRHG
ncbi:transporter substrate-binding domain-containing protein [Chitinibacter fontanus]|uniref:Transporter substrate-binding domain-containing protein n=1 Tax=Chitinibacter fontanus TaxID=1737446 RepID=A0A7D5V8D5_9NEIS|nr:transporter substrate-binding domain-containing protein [Chitinibacter fontanus]QLI80837.1 transporter substrate-binding domain-containing protein [Chitinibacter fontanus]